MHSRPTHFGTVSITATLDTDWNLDVSGGPGIWYDIWLSQEQITPRPIPPAVPAGKVNLMNLLADDERVKEARNARAKLSQFLATTEQGLEKCEKTIREAHEWVDEHPYEYTSSYEEKLRDISGAFADGCCARADAKDDEGNLNADPCAIT
jgi:hypothetical protein